MSANSLGKALITGASTGIGAVYADRLAKQGYDLILVARSADKLEALSKKLIAATGRSVEVLPADLTNAHDVRAVEDVLKSDKNISLLINNAGAGGVKPLLDSDVDDMERMITLNITALTRLTYAAVPGFIARGRGTIINIASVVAIAPELLNGVYGSSKSYVLSFSHSLNHELADKGIRVQAVLPGATATDFWSIAGKPVEELPQSIVMSTDDMVDAALAGLKNGERVTIPGLHDVEKWTDFEAARGELSTLFGNSNPAARYL
ncbi:MULTISPECIES: SDR family NAD(P)-dependent oxidoreductase [Brucella/Ochrobactrum group]|uniref:SDR family NAD(P)-dependent oxidoreductase n=1 Tax=Brucella/Ochrobactrum group TaxID=2826938 RepID=UPI001C05B5C3|nr:SDR family oxidoreductase [Brucella sp. NBRC 12950]QWK79917.1 SDR family oxidoreductase [Ochrobactrum sp. BTU1]GLU27210.1 oxidoreductase [Brucella sp. NBRC 12950]